MVRKDPKTGGWVGSVELGLDANGKRQRVWARGQTKRETQERLEEKVRKHKEGQAAETDDSVAVLLETWLESKRNEVRHNTFEWYEQCVRLHIRPFLGRKRVGEVTSLDIKKLELTLAKSRTEGGSGLAPSTVRAVHKVLAGVFASAVRWEMIQRNPVTYAGTPRVDRKERRTLSFEEAQSLLEGLRQHHYYIPVLIMLMTGMRRGEVLGLRWGDVDWERRTLTIERDLVSSPQGLRFNPPKTPRSRRTISLPEKLMRELELYKKAQAEWKEKVGSYYQDQDLIVAQKDGRPVRPESLSAWWNRYRKSHNLDLRVHDFRHTHATWGLQEGINPKVMSERLGHSDIAITLGLYSHVTEAMQQPVVDFLDERFQS